jgi:membrane-bound ClpP family serine protease
MSEDEKLRSDEERGAGRPLDGAQAPEKGVPMWIGAGVLLGVVAVASIVGFHIGHYAHMLATAAGVAAAGVLIGMAASGNTQPLVFVLLGADAVVTAGVGTIAWKGMRDPSLRAAHHVHSIVGKEGVAVGSLDPAGIVRVQGENWTASSLNGRIEDGDRVQVIGIEGVRLSVWGEHGVAEVSQGLRGAELPTAGVPVTEPEGNG